MSTTSLTKVGNSMAVLLPKALREEAGIDKDTALNIASPRKGVVVITAYQDNTKDRLQMFREAEKFFEDNAKNMKPWPKGFTAEDAIREGKDAKVAEIDSL